jgi:hypothetical protein
MTINACIMVGHASQGPLNRLRTIGMAPARVRLLLKKRDLAWSAPAHHAASILRGVFLAEDWLDGAITLRRPFYLEEASHLIDLVGLRLDEVESIFGCHLDSDAAWVDSVEAWLKDHVADGVKIDLSILKARIKTASVEEIRARLGLDRKEASHEGE